MSISHGGDETPNKCCNDCIERCDQINHPCVCHLTMDEKLTLIIEKMSKVEALTVKVIEDLKPTLDDLMKSPILKMLGMKK